MLLNRLAYTICGLLLAAQVSADTISLSDENKSYECARSVSTIVERASQHGPLFFEDGLVFTSVDSNGISPILILDVGNGLYQISLEGTGLNRLRFSLTNRMGKELKFYMSYMHGSSTMRSRYFDFGRGRAPLGHDELDYTEVKPLRASHLLDHMAYAIHETMENTMTDLTEGRIQRNQISPIKVSSCDYIGRRTPSVGRSLRRNLDVVEMIVLGPAHPTIKSASRMPASVP